MPSLHFSLTDYQDALVAGRYTPPDNLCPYYEVDPVLYRKYGTTNQRRGRLGEALEELRKRTDRTYFRNTYPLQAQTLDYSSRSFPAYRFILPEVMTEDWLALVDWGRFQRDHVLHQSLCGYVVLKMLDGDGAGNPLCAPDGTPLLDACVNRILCWEGTNYIREFLLECGMREDNPILIADNPVAKAVWRSFFREAAYVAAVFHDLGYPWQYAGRLQENLDGMNASSMHQNRGVAQIVEQFGHKLLFHALRGYQKVDAASPSMWKERLTQLTDTALSRTHGLPGALGFLHLNDCVRCYPVRTQSPLHLLCVEWVAVAIMMHDMAKVYWGEGFKNNGMPENPSLRLRFEKDPLSAIVALADVIEEFDRPTVSYEMVGANDDRVALKYSKACSSTTLEVDEAGVMTVCYGMDTHEQYMQKLKCMSKDEREYFDVHHGYLDMGGLGISAVRLQAVESPGD